MLITRQKFRSRMLGNYIRLCHIITHNMHETWGLNYLCAMRTLPTSFHVVPQIYTDIMHALCGACMQASQPPYVYMVHQELIMDVPFVQAEQYLLKITASHSSTLNTKFANQNVLKRILIAMLNKNKANSNENFKICAGEPVAPLYMR